MQLCFIRLLWSYCAVGDESCESTIVACANVNFVQPTMSYYARFTGGVLSGSAIKFTQLQGDKKAPTTVQAWIGYRSGYVPDPEQTEIDPDSTDETMNHKWYVHVAYLFCFHFRVVFSLTHSRITMHMAN
jgi:hypothetical protein